MPLSSYLILATVLFAIGAIAFAGRRNMLNQLMAIEVMMNSAALVLVAFNRAHPENHSGQVFAVFVIAIAAAEAAVGLAIAIAYFRVKRTVHTDLATLLRN